MEDLNTEEKRILVETCSAYMDIFYVPGDKLISTNATKSTIRLESGLEPV